MTNIISFAQFFDISDFWLNKTSKLSKKKPDAQVGRVNTFHILQTIREGPLNFKLVRKDPLYFHFSKF
jgi:hypothetical protein